MRQAKSLTHNNLAVLLCIFNSISLFVSGSRCPLVGHYCVDGALDPIECPTGSYCVLGHRAPTPCPFGTFNNQTRSTNVLSCRVCPSGHYCPVGTSNPFSCPPGTFGAVLGLGTFENCTACTAGHYCKGVGETTPSGSCSKGYYCPLGTEFATQFPCPRGTYNPETAADSFSNCLTCPAGHECPKEGSSAPTQCVAGTYCPQGTSDAVLCEPGTYNSSPGLTSCSNCSSGVYCVAGTSDPVPCPAGYYCPTSTKYAAQYPCAKGTSNSDTGRSEACSSCDAGTFCNFTGLASVSGVCPAGAYCPLGTSNPPPCPAGTYNPSTGLTNSEQCTACPAGYYCLEGSTAVSGICPMGYYCNGSTEYSTQTPCPQGTYLNISGAVSVEQCLLCPVTTYGPRSGIVSVDQCTKCSGEYFCNQTGLAAPFGPCNSSTFCPPGSANPFMCDSRAPSVGPSNIQFIDLDLSRGKIEGIVTWDPAPGIFLSYTVYASSDGVKRSLRLSGSKSLFPFPYNLDVAFGTNFLELGEATSIESTQVHFSTPKYILVVPRNQYGEQCGNLAAVPFVDLIVPSNLTFFDIDVSGSHIGGIVTWIAGSAPDLSGYSLYLSNGGIMRSVLVTSSIAANATSHLLSNGTFLASATHLLLTMHNADGVEYSNYVTWDITDQAVSDAVVTDVNFLDEGVENGNIKGTVTWAIPFDTRNVLEYAVYFSSDGVIREIEITNTGRPSFNEGSTLVTHSSVNGTSLNGTFIVVVAVNHVGENVIHAKTQVIDRHVPLHFPTTASFADHDPEPGAIGGWVTWKKPIAVTDIDYFRVYASADGVERTIELTSGKWDQRSRKLFSEASSFFVPLGSRAVSYLLIVPCNHVGCSRSALSTAVTDSSVYNVTAVKCDPLSATSMQLSWNAPSIGNANRYTVLRYNHDYSVAGFKTLISRTNLTSYADREVTVLDDGVNIYTYEIRAGTISASVSRGVRISCTPAAREIREKIENFRVSEFSSNSLTVRWTPDFRASTYFISIRKSNSGSRFEVVANVPGAADYSTGIFDPFPGAAKSNSLEFEVGNLQINTTYDLEIFGSNSHGNQTANIPQLTATTTGAPPDGLEVTLGSALPWGVPMIWTPLLTVTHYQIEIKKAFQNDTEYALFQKDTLLDYNTGYDSNLEPGFEYAFRVSAVNNFGSVSVVSNATTIGQIVKMELSGTQVVLEPGCEAALGA